MSTANLNPNLLNKQDIRHSTKHQCWQNIGMLNHYEYWSLNIIETMFASSIMSLWQCRGQIIPRALFWIHSTVLCKSNANEISSNFVLCSLFSRIFERNFALSFAKFCAKSLTAKRYFERNSKEISLDISEGQTKNRYFENSQTRNFARQLTN